MTAVDIELKFSASRASKYHNCHASANLPAAIPGFVVKPKERKAATSGTAQHEFFSRALLNGNHREIADMLMKLAAVRDTGKARFKLIANERDYLVWWFMLEKRGPVIEHEHVRELLYWTSLPDGSGQEQVGPKPIELRFIATALVYIADILQDGGGELITEESRKATWLLTSPGTTVDVIIKQGKKMHVLDLKMGTIVVEVVENEQLLYYGKTFVYDEVEELELHIMQQKNLASWHITREYLESWAEQVQQSEDEILAGDLSFKVGKHCDFCPANPRSFGERGWPSCPVLAELLYGEKDAVAEEASMIDEEDEEL
jgi:hypothetical protein